jgi:hypothetical protein
VQRITTKEPTLGMLEVAIVSIKCALRDDFPEFSEFYASRAWEKKPEAVVEEEAATEEQAVTEETPEEPVSDFECEIQAAREEEENDA